MLLEWGNEYKVPLVAMNDKPEMVSRSSGSMLDR
jgi:hypothetical protein